MIAGRIFLVPMLMVAVTLPDMRAFAVEGKEVAYVNGTVSTVNEGEVGTVSTTSAATLDFKTAGGGFSIPYARVISFQYRDEVRYHLGVLPAIAVGLVKKRAKRHFVTISWQGDGKQVEVVTLEMAKSRQQGLISVLQARPPSACKPAAGQVCGRTW